MRHLGRGGRCDVLGAHESPGSNNLKSPGGVGSSEGTVTSASNDDNERKVDLAFGSMICPEEGRGKRATSQEPIPTRNADVPGLTRAAKDRIESVVLKDHIENLVSSRVEDLLALHDRKTEQKCLASLLPHVGKMVATSIHRHIDRAQNKYERRAKELEEKWQMLETRAKITGKEHRENMERFTQFRTEVLSELRARLEGSSGHIAKMQNRIDEFESKRETEESTGKVDKRKIDELIRNQMPGLVQKQMDELMRKQASDAMAAGNLDEIHSIIGRLSQDIQKVEEAREAITSKVASIEEYVLGMKKAKNERTQSSLDSLSCDIVSMQSQMAQVIKAFEKLSEKVETLESKERKCSNGVARRLDSRRSDGEHKSGVGSDAESEGELHKGHQNAHQRHQDQLNGDDNRTRTNRSADTANITSATSTARDPGKSNDKPEKREGHVAAPTGRTNVNEAQAERKQRRMAEAAKLRLSVLKPFIGIMIQPGRYFLWVHRFFLGSWAYKSTCTYSLPL